MTPTSRPKIGPLGCGPLHLVDDPATAGKAAARGTICWSGTSQLGLPSIEARQPLPELRPHSIELHVERELSSSGQELIGSGCCPRPRTRQRSPACRRADARDEDFFFPVLKNSRSPKNLPAPTRTPNQAPPLMKGMGCSEELPPGRPRSEHIQTARGGRLRGYDPTSQTDLPLVYGSCRGHQISPGSSSS
jgi:hypothetical protein